MRTPSIHHAKWWLVCPLALLFQFETARAQILNEAQKLLASDGAEVDLFGNQSVSVSGDVIIVGAHGDDDNGSFSGSAYVFRRNGSVWVQEQKLLASDTAANDRFGQDVSISGDVALIGAMHNETGGISFGAAYVFRWNGSSWLEEQKLVAADRAEDDQFGSSVSIDGDVAVVGAYLDDDNGISSGSAYVFRWNGSSWVQEQKLLPSDGAESDEFGWSISLSGNVAVVGAELDHESGSAYVFRWNGASWVEEQKLAAADGSPGDHFAFSVSVSENVILIGAPLDDDNGVWSGSAYIFHWNGASWVQEQKLLDSDGGEEDIFGRSVSVSGDLAVVGIFASNDNGVDSGSAYSFRWNGSSWMHEYKLLPTDGEDHDYFGASVALSGNVAIVGTRGDDDNGALSGSAYVFYVACDPGYYGQFCVPCPVGPANPCNGHGTCDDGPTGTGECTCYPGFGGSTCLPLPRGACCSNSTCTYTTSDLCTNGATFTVGVRCQGLTACCLWDESCVDADAACCKGQGGIPADLGVLCDDEQFPGCVPVIPTVSGWGLVVLTLLIMVGSKVAFRYRRAVDIRS